MSSSKHLDRKMNHVTAYKKRVELLFHADSERYALDNYQIDIDDFELKDMKPGEYQGELKLWVGEPIILEKN